MQTYAPGDAPRALPVLWPLRAIRTRQRPCLLALPLRAFAALTNCTRGAPCAHDAGGIAVCRPPGRSIPPAPAPRSAPARALAARQAAPETANARPARGKYRPHRASRTAARIRRAAAIPASCRPPRMRPRPRLRVRSGRPGMRRAANDAGGEHRPAWQDRTRPAPAPPWRCPAWPPVMRLANGAWPSSPRQAACRATPCPAEPRQRLAPLAFSPLLPPALPSPPSLRHCAPHGRPSGACGSPLATVCPSGPPAPLRAPAPARPGCRAAPARTALLVFGSPACHPSAPRRWLPKSRRWRDGELWISRLFSPSLHHECRSAGACCHKTKKNQGMALVHCRICYLLLTLSAPFFRLLPSSERWRQWHTSKNASTATALPLTGC